MSLRAVLVTLPQEAHGRPLAFAHGHAAAAVDGLCCVVTLAHLPHVGQDDHTQTHPVRGPAMLLLLPPHTRSTAGCLLLKTVVLQLAARLRRQQNSGAGGAVERQCGHPRARLCHKQASSSPAVRRHRCCPALPWRHVVPAPSSDVDLRARALTLQRHTQGGSKQPVDAGGACGCVADTPAVAGLLVMPVCRVHGIALQRQQHGCVC